VAQNKKITVFTGVQVKEIAGAPKGKMTHLKLSKPCAPVNSKPTDLFPADALFVLIGQAPLSILLGEMGVKLNAKGEVIVDREMRTNVEGVYAAGDVNDSVFKQAIVSASDGVVAAYSAFEHLGKKKK
jgi:thioredoxin reductase (NADPH)